MGRQTVRWTSSGRRLDGYYGHLYTVEQLEDSEKAVCLEKLRADIEICLAVWPCNYVVKHVAETLSS